ncbi:hypothetical protein KORDIASMS9_03771 [Kordia sp. SMS9]|uniref:hypothetical protein n=1 Tax=Kordia sp. SMS9 TaxID=2282170 RepID=UPI000E0DE533|nr:hypothetical protein [Kordia sp. SMS9]AXG71514.1 hypothetical protein KORDIASMS9_03771 [Kordia sp. SMS9]
MNRIKPQVTSFTAKVKRTKDAASADKIHVFATIKTNFTATVVKFSQKHLYTLRMVDNAGDAFNLLKYDIYLIPSLDEDASEQMVQHENLFKLEKEDGVQFEFDEEENSLFMMEVKIQGTRPEGTKRRVITYEDCDEIDEAMGY